MALFWRILVTAKKQQHSYTYITHHTSYITHHTSYITHHKSHIIHRDKPNIMASPPTAIRVKCANPMCNCDRCTCVVCNCGLPSASVSMDKRNNKKKKAVDLSTAATCLAPDLHNPRPVTPPAIKKFRKSYRNEVGARFIHYGLVDCNLPGKDTRYGITQHLDVNDVDVCVCCMCVVCVYCVVFSPLPGFFKKEP